MRWPVVFTAGVGLIWSIASGVYSLKDMSNDGGMSRDLKDADDRNGEREGVRLDLGDYVLCRSGCRGFRLPGRSPGKHGRFENVAETDKQQNVKLARYMKIAGLLGVLVAVASQIVAVAAHFIVKVREAPCCCVPANGRMTLLRSV